MIWSKTTGIASGITKAMNTALLLTTAQPQIAAKFLTGNPKVVCVFWEGDITEGEQSDFDPERGDGRVEILYPGCPGYQVPPCIDEDDAAFNIRASVPLWLLRSPDRPQDEPTVLGAGALHPRWSAATVDLYDPCNRRHLVRALFGDPRRDMNRMEDGWPSFALQKRQIREAGGELDGNSVLAPRHKGFLEIETFQP